ncbi:hypothetical protein SEA_MPHALCON_129 [Mycobacterium phage MPhalcon]|nr:hypothetical protein SEA_MISSY_130 [Mycobacterium phage MISSy]AVP42910.1 hypothetical protein SEA_MPHALCON_129 [Mycobacterium phage MPhalcon]QZD96968.1 hypothetical protein SEA_THRESHER_129 [Mycobacterium phage Thresher]
MNVTRIDREGYAIRSITYGANAPTSHAGSTRWFAGRYASTGSGRVASWCSHYHETRAEAEACGIEEMSKR